MTYYKQRIELNRFDIIAIESLAEQITGSKDIVTADNAVHVDTQDHLRLSFFKVNQNDLFILIDNDTTSESAEAAIDFAAFDHRGYNYLVHRSGNKEEFGNLELITN